MVWSRAIDSGPLDTPERRAAIDRKLRAEISQLRDETVRRYYQAEIDKRLKALFAPASRGEYSRNTYAPAGDTVGRPWQRGRMTPPKAGAAIREQLRPSSSLAKSSLFNRSGGISPREALILVTLIAHPDRLMTHTDEIAGLDFSHADTQAIARILLDELAESAGRDTHPTPDTLRAAIERAGMAEQYRRIEAVMLLGDKNKALLGDRDAIDDLLKQALTLHRRTSTLHKELKLAERAFSDDPNEVNLAWLSDLRAQISAFEGTEADTEMIRENEIPWPVVKR
jgi:DNA primase